MSQIEGKLSAFHRGQILTEGLILVREDICDWFSALFENIVITGATFLTSMHTGVLLCDLLHRIYLRMTPSKLPSHWPKRPPNADRRALPLSFKARDNVSLFLSWCRSAGLRNTILFETKGLMDCDEEKNVVLTLLHLGEALVDLDVPVPQFARFKKEMEDAQRSDVKQGSVSTLTDHSDIGSVDSGFNSSRSTSTVDCPDATRQTAARSSSTRTPETDSDKIYHVMSASGRPAKGSLARSHIRDLKKTPSQVNRQMKTRSKSIGSICAAGACSADSCYSGSTRIDAKVREIARRCCCETKFQIERTTMHEGMYRIGAKNIFVRMFKENVMLRIGGGWETLNEYIDKVDPCCKGQTRRKSTGNLLASSLSTETLSPRELRKFSHSELTKVKKIKPANQATPRLQ